jgi:hypothetical protein
MSGVDIAIDVALVLGPVLAWSNGQITPTKYLPRMGALRGSV